MNEESRPDDYQPGDYIDYFFNNGWVVKLILVREQTPSLDDNLKLKDPRTLAIAVQTISVKSPRIKPFRTHASARSYQNVGYLVRSRKYYDIATLVKRREELQQFTEQLGRKSPKQLVQFLRGRHFFFVDELVNSQMEEREKYEAVMDYLQAHRRLFTKYLLEVDFDQASGKNFYDSQMSALCSAYPELIEATNSATGVSSDFDNIKKEYANWHDHVKFSEQVSKWVEEELLPALEQSKHSSFPPSFLFQLFSTLGALFSRIISSRIPQLGRLYELLFEDLKRNMVDQPFTSRQLIIFLNNCESYFKVFPYQEEQSDSDASQTEQIEAQGLSKPEEKRRNHAWAMSRDQFVRWMKVEFRVHLLRILLKHKDMQKFAKDFCSLTVDVFARIPPGSASEEWPQTVKSYIGSLLYNQFLQAFFSIPAASLETGMHRNLLLKVLPIIPKQLIHIIIASERLTMLRYIIPCKQVVDLDMIGDMTAEIRNNSEHTDNPKEYLDYFTYLEKYLKTHYQSQTLMRERLISFSFKIATYLNKDEHEAAMENLLDLSDPVKLALWKDFTEDEILIQANDRYSYFQELCIQRYFQKFKIDRCVFREVCFFMSDTEIKEEQYQIRKVTVIQALHYQWKFNRDNYLDFLEIFIYFFTHRDHDKEMRNWVALLPYPSDQKLSAFLQLPISVAYCEQNLQKLNPLYFETDINIYLRLVLKLNLLKRHVVLSKDGESIGQVLEYPEYFREMVNQLFSDLTEKRFKLIEKEIEKYFLAATDNQPVYNAMLETLLEVLMLNEARRPQVNLLFKKLKTRYHLVPKMGMVGSGAKSEQATVICRNTRVAQRCADFNQRKKDDKYFLPFFEDEKTKMWVEVQFNRLDTLKVIRHRLAWKINRQPNDIVFLLAGQRLGREKESLSFQEVYFQQFYSEQKSKETPYIEFVPSEEATPIKSQIIDRMPKLYGLLPSTFALLRGLQLIEEDWQQKFALRFMQTMFKGYLSRGQFLQQEMRTAHKLDFLLDYYIWKLQQKQRYNFNPLVHYLKRIDNADSIIKNYKIVYLLSQGASVELSFDQCDCLMLCLLPEPVPSKEKMEKNCQAIRANRQYQLLEEMVFSLVEKRCGRRLEFMSVCNYCAEFSLYEQFYQTYEKLWSKVYSIASLQEKTDFFSNIEQTIANYPDNMSQFYSVIGFEEQTSNTAFYQEAIAHLTKILLALNRDNLTITEMKTIEVLITNISELTDQVKLFHPILQSKELLEFVKSNIYQLSERTQRELMNIARIIVFEPSNRVALLEFFEKETREKEWLARPFLVRAIPKQMQLEGRVGLRNPHSICYVNSFLQQLFHIDLFRLELFQTQFAQNHNQQEDLIYQLKKIFLHLAYGRQAYFNADFFKAFKSIEGGDTCIDVQMDVDQFRNLLLDRIQNAIPSNNNFVKRLFNGKQRSIIRSQQCQHQSKKEEEFSSLCIEVKDFSNLQDSLNNYFKPEILNNQNAYHCDQCKRKVTAEKIIEIESLPPYLTFVLKRFEYVSYNRYKINTYFQFPLDDFQYFKGSRYTLKGVIVHMGISEAGHYISYAKHNHVWYEFNDCNVNEVKEQRLKENCYGTNTKGPSISISQTKNAYVLIYEAEKLPERPVPEGSDPSFYGILDEYKKIVKHRLLSNKERIYFSQYYLETLNYIAQRFSEPSSLHILFWSLMSIHLRIKSEGVKYEVILKSFGILKRNQCEFKFLWYESEQERVIEVFTSQMNPEYKSILVHLMVENCEHYNQHVEKMLEICLKKIYQEKTENSGYYMFMHAMAKKFEEACKYLNSQRIVGRVLDVLFMGIIGEKVRETLKKTCEVQFQSVPLNLKAYKDNSKAQFKYHKWALVCLILERCSFQLHEIQKQHYLFQMTNLTLQALFLQASEKPTIKYMSKYFAILTKDNQEIYGRLIPYISEQIREKGDIRKYMKVLKEIAAVNCDHIEERNRSAVNVFNRNLKKLLEEKRDATFVFVWQWFLDMMKSNEVFKKKVIEYKAALEFLTVVSPQSLSIHRKVFDGVYRFEPTKQPIYGIIAPTTLAQAEALINAKKDETDMFLCDQFEGADLRDLDGDILNIKLQDGEIILRYDQAKLKYSKVAVHFTFADLVVIRNLDRIEKIRHGACEVVFRGDERLRLRTQQIADMLILQPSNDKPYEEQQSHSPKAI